MTSPSPASLSDTQKTSMVGSSWFALSDCFETVEGFASFNLPHSYASWNISVCVPGADREDKTFKNKFMCNCLCIDILARHLSSHLE